MRSKANYRETRTLSGNSLKFADNPQVQIAANSRVDVLLHLECKKPESFHEYFEILERQSGESLLYFQVMAEIQKPMVKLNRCGIHLGKIYAGV